jgi:predicted kinase
MVVSVIVDIDGTLSRPEHRLYHLDSDPKDWQSFHDAMGDDPPHEAVVWLVRTIGLATRWLDDRKIAILIVTARHEPYRATTEAWLAKHNIVYDKLYMRADNDFRKDHIVKADILQQIVADGYEPFLAIDDRPEVVETWRDWGIATLQCAYGRDRTRFAGQHLLTVLVGPAGAGKSTYVAKNFKPSEVISTDEIRKELFGEYLGLDPVSLRKTFDYARDLVKARLRNGLHTVVDATNLRKRDRLTWVDCAPNDSVVHYILLNRDYDEKIASRGWRSVELIDRHHQTFKNTTLIDMKTMDGRGNIVLYDKREKK